MIYLSQMAMTLTCVFFLIGLVSTFLPILPGCVIIWAGILVHKLIMADASVSWIFFWFATGMVVMVHLLDWFMTYLGVRLFGASWRGGVGAIIGLILGPLFLTVIPGIGTFAGFLIGPVLGALAGELLGGQTWGQAGKAGFGTIFGAFLAFIVRFSVACFIVVSFFYSVPRGV